MNDEPIRVGSIINLKNGYPGGGYLDTRGQPRDQPLFAKSPELYFVSTNPSPNRATGSGSWKVVSASGKASGTQLVVGDRIHLLNMHPGGGYLDTAGWVKNMTMFKQFPENLGVFTSRLSNRDQGSGTWTIRSASGKAKDTPLVEGDAIYLENGYNQGGFLDTCGFVPTCDPFTQGYEGQLLLVFTSTSNNRDNGSGTWTVSLSKDVTPFDVDSYIAEGAAKKTASQLIPLQGTNISLTGPALNGPYSTLFDTGSWTLSLPESAVNPAKRTVIDEGPVDDGWGNQCRLVKGTLGVKAEDGTEYLTEFEFYEILSTSTGGRGPIMGAFPSLDRSSRASLPYALVREHFLSPDGVPSGFGIVSKAPTDEKKVVKPVDVGWSELRLYLHLGANPTVTAAPGIVWRTDVPSWNSAANFCPEGVPGFQVRVSVPGSDKKIVSPKYLATIDTGAPDLTARLGEQNQHLDRALPFAPFFKDTGPGWWSGGTYAKDARSLEGGKVTISFTEYNEYKDQNEGVTQEYTFEAKGYTQSPATLFAGTWTGNVPWPPKEPEFPLHRINLGNTVYYHCTVVFFDIANKRVGFRFL